MPRHCHNTQSDFSHTNSEQMVWGVASCFIISMRTRKLLFYCTGCSKKINATKQKKPIKILDCILLWISVEYGTTKVWWPGSFNFCCFNWQLGLFPVATCQPSTSLAAKQANTVGDDIVTTGNEECCPWQHCNFRPKTWSSKLGHTLLCENTVDVVAESKMQIFN